MKLNLKHRGKLKAAELAELKPGAIFYLEEGRTEVEVVRVTKHHVIGMSGDVEYKIPHDTFYDAYLNSNLTFKNHD